MLTFSLRNVLIVGSVSTVAAHSASGGVLWLLGVASDRQAIAFIAGSAGGIAIVWLVYLVGLLCRWLRRKQVEGDDNAPIQ